MSFKKFLQYSVLCILDAFLIVIVILLWEGRLTGAGLVDEAVSKTDVAIQQMATSTNIATEKTNVQKSGDKSIPVPDSPCVNKRYKYTGPEEIYSGYLKPGSPVTVTLLCDRDQLNIEGSVEQIITNPHPDRETMGLVATLGAHGIALETDYNFDGYNDLETIPNQGSGWQAIVDYDIFLYDPLTKQFKYSQELSALSWLQVDSKNKTLRSGRLFVKGGVEHHGGSFEIFTWDGPKLVKSAEYRCVPDTDDETKGFDDAFVDITGDKVSFTEFFQSFNEDGTKKGPEEIRYNVPECSQQ
jgi:hypothetical protein